MKWQCDICGIGPIEVNGNVVHRCKGIRRTIVSNPKAEQQAAKLVKELPDESRLLLGDRIKELTMALGIPACSSCEKRKAWLNSAHQWVLDTIGSKVKE